MEYPGTNHKLMYTMFFAFTPRLLLFLTPEPTAPTESQHLVLGETQMGTLHMWDGLRIYPKL